MSKSRRTTKNSLKVRNYEQQELVYQTILQETLKPSVLMTKKLLEMSKENESTASTSLEGKEVNSEENSKEKSPNKSPKAKGGKKSLKHHLISDSESDPEGTQPSPTKKKKHENDSGEDEEANQSDQDGGQHPLVTNVGQATHVPMPQYLQGQASNYPNFGPPQTPTFEQFWEYKQFLELTKSKGPANQQFATGSPYPMTDPAAGSSLQGPPPSPPDLPVDSGDESKGGGEVSASPQKDSSGRAPNSNEAPQKEDGAAPAKPEGVKAKLQREAEEADEDTNFGPEASELMVKLVRKLVKASRKQSKIDELAKTHRLPANMPFLQSPRIHKTVFGLMDERATYADKQYRQMQGVLGGGIATLVKALDIIIEKEDDIPELIPIGELISDGLKMFAFSNRDINVRRRDALK